MRVPRSHLSLAVWVDRVEARSRPFCPPPPTHDHEDGSGPRGGQAPAAVLQSDGGTCLAGHPGCGSGPDVQQLECGGRGVRGGGAYLP